MKRLGAGSLDDITDESGRVLPSAFMRQLRPEYYSDTVDRTAYQLDKPTLEYHLDTVTARNQTHDFEIFCRKLCERTICPNLKPSTGPEGGGDSKADTETIPVADEIATLSYVGAANAGRERWAFAFSAKKRWGEKVRSDVSGIIATDRGYQKIFCVTAQFARARDRARVEDELTKQYGVAVTILDRTWIVEQIIDGDHKDLAFNYLGVGNEVEHARRVGPSDYSRIQQLEDIESALKDPQRFVGMEGQRVTEALVAAKLSRNLERPRIETEGRFSRAVRLAEERGSYRQPLEAKYEQIWTSFWWFDDFALLNSSYDEFEALALNADHARNIEFLCNLAQLLFNIVIHGHLSADEVKLAERVERLIRQLEAMATDSERPNNALEARTSLLVLQVNQAWTSGESESLAEFWPQFSEIVEQATGLGEFQADRLVQMIKVFGNVAGTDKGYASLVDQVAEFVSKRISEGQGALVLLERAKQLDFDDRFEMIRLLGKAAYQLSKKEYTGSLVEATRLLSLAYRGAGLLWAARASCIFAIASIIIEAEEDSDLPASIVPTFMLLGWIAVELRHLPDTFDAIRMVRGCIAVLPLDDESKELASKRLEEFDLVLASQILNFGTDELHQSTGLPDVLGGLALHHSRISLLYALGHEKALREHGEIPEDETAKSVGEFFNLLANQPASDNLKSPVIRNETGPQTYLSTVLGIKVEVNHQGSDTAILAAEAVIGSIEALFATTIDLNAPPHTEGFTVTIEESADSSVPTFSVDQDHMSATVLWPSGRAPASFGKQGEAHEMLVGLACSIFAATCAVRDIQGTMTRFFEDDGVLHRIAMIAGVGNSRQRVFKSAVSRLRDWTSRAEDSYELQSSRPEIVRRKIERSEETETEQGSSTSKDDAIVASPPTDHRALGICSIIDVHLWDRASWVGTAFVDWGPRYPPTMALLFSDTDGARAIFERWRDRFGAADRREEIYIAIIRGISVDEPAHYRVLVTSRLPKEQESRGQTIMLAARMNTMHAEAETNLLRFLDSYSKAGAYLLTPAIWEGTGKPRFLMELSILKKELSLKRADEIEESDVEAMALGQRND